MLSSGTVAANPVQCCGFGVACSALDQVTRHLDYKPTNNHIAAAARYLRWYDVLDAPVWPRSIIMPSQWWGGMLQALKFISIRQRHNSIPGRFPHRDRIRGGMVRRLSGAAIPRYAYNISGNTSAGKVGSYRNRFAEKKVPFLRYNTFGHKRNSAYCHTGGIESYVAAD